MTLLGGLLPVIEEKENSRPITANLEPHVVDDFLREQARLERLSQSTINSPNAKQLYLEPVTHELFDLYSSINEDTPMTDATDNELDLFPVGQLNIMDESDIEDTTTTTETPLLRLDLLAYRKRREETNQRLKRLMIVPGREEATNKKTVPPATENDSVLPTTVEPTPLTSAQITLQQPKTVPAPALAPVLQSPELALVHAPQQLEPVTKEANNVPLPTIAATEPSTIITATINTTSAWFDNSQIDTTTSSSTDSSKKPIYAYPDCMIPIFTTQAQQVESDLLSKSSSAQMAMFFSMHFDKTIGALNNPSVMVDAPSEEKWQLSGKHLFIQELLANLEQHNLTLCIVTKDMEDEARLLDLIRDHLKLDCLRINTAVDAWDGEYGIVVRTRKHQERIGAFADLVICMDVRISRDNEVFDKIKGANGQKPTVAWLVSLGSIESKVFNYLKDNDASFAASKSNMEFKKLILEPNEWPPSSECQKMNTMIADNVSSWLLTETKQSVDYQFRSITCLYQSYQLGSLLAENNDDTQDVMDMDISSDSELVDLTIMNTYIEKVKNQKSEINTKMLTFYD
jgi:hypothetical protein